jgi:hypothetical protein
VISLYVYRFVSQVIVGLIGHLRTHFPAMYRLYDIMKSHTDPPSEEELAIASGAKVLDAEAANSYLGRVKVAGSANLLSMFTKQSQENAVSEMRDTPLLIS